MKHNRERPLKRRGPILEARPRILIICEGKSTEPGYFRAFSDAERNPLVEIEIDGTGGGPKTLVERAATQRKADRRIVEQTGDPFAAYDEIWCVFDIDEHPKIADAQQQARDNNIKLAISNPCFELWLLLHFQDHHRYIERRPLASQVRQHLPGYEKDVPFQRVHPTYEAAVKRASRLNLTHERNGTEGANPSTYVHLLTERIKNPRR